MRQLGGEFVCVPFGMGGTPQDLVDGWDAAAWAKLNPLGHGPSADAEWHCMSHDASHVLLSLTYPVDDDIEFLTRRITAASDVAGLDFELTIHARRSTRYPVGLHPILRLPEPPAAIHIEAAFGFGCTYPGTVPPGVSRVAPGRFFTTLDAVPTLDGGTVDYATLPHEAPTEDMLQLCKVSGPIDVLYPNEQARLQLTWDTTLLPSCLLWPSDRALSDPPWNRSFRGLGVEPIAALFDASRAAASAPNPLSERGVATALRLEPGMPVTIRYRLEACDLARNHAQNAHD